MKLKIRLITAIGLGTLLTLLPASIPLRKAGMHSQGSRGPASDSVYTGSALEAKTNALVLESRGKDPNRIWPGKRFPRDLVDSAYLSNPFNMCSDFIDHTIRKKPLIPGNSDSIEQTDQIEVLKHGKVIFQWADSPAYTLSSRHYLWSASKTVTATIMAAAIQAGLKTPAGHRLTLDTPLSEFYPFEEHASSGPSPSQPILPAAQDRELYQKIKLKDLIMMGSGMKWDESYESDPATSSFMPMLYTVGRSDMVSFALRAPMQLEPGKLFNYSGGNVMLMMGMLRKMMPDNGGPGFENRLLFDPLGMSSALYERDAKGNRVGCSYAHMNPEDMLKFGYLYLNGGFWKGKRILPPGWLERVQTLSDTLTAPGNLTGYDDLKSEGVWSNGAFWLNKAVHGNWTDKNGQHQTVWGPEMKKSPPDLFFAAGHYGQLILIIPSEDMVIARTAHDAKYWDNDVSPIINKIDPLVSGAISCFRNWEAQ